MGKDNLTFHTVIFPCTLLATEKPWTLLNTISTTEFLNYEYEIGEDGKQRPAKFSKSFGTGVFGDDAMSTKIPVEVWRYYLLINRPEQQDTVFLWDDFIAKNNNELLKNLGNFTNRALAFTASKLKGIIPACGEHEQDTQFLESLQKCLELYFENMDALKIKDGLRNAMDYSSLCNGYFQETKPWDLAKGGDMARCEQVVATAVNALYLLCTILEPFMPSFSAKVYA